jgi:hypothetical protein
LLFERWHYGQSRVHLTIRFTYRLGRASPMLPTLVSN